MGQNFQTPKWPHAHEARLRRVAPTGLSARLIAAKLNRAFPGATYTRNAVIGKCHRMGLELKGVGGGSKPRVPE